MRRGLILAVATALALSANAGDTTPTLAQLRTRVRDTSEPIQPRVIVGEPSSSLGKDQVVALAQEYASRIPGAAVAQLSQEYRGQFSPAIPVNSVLVIEPIEFVNLRPFDIVLFSDPSAALRIRRVMAKGSDRVTLGFEMAGTASAEVAADKVLGRVVAVFLHKPLDQ